MIKRITMKNVIVILMIFYVSNLFSQTNFNKFIDEAFYHYQQNDLTSAINKFSKALEYKNEVSNGYKVAEAYMSRGICRQSLQNYVAALQDFNEGLKIKPEFIKLYQSKVRLYVATKKYSDAIQWADKGLEIKPFDSDLMLKKSEAFHYLKKYDEAILTLKLLNTEYPKNKMGYKYTASNYQYKKNWDSTLKYFEKAIELDPLDMESFYDRGIAYAHMKDTLNAMKDIRHAMQLDTANRWIGYNNIAYFIKFEEKDFNSALNLLNNAIKLNPEFAYAYSNRGYAKMNLGDLKGAHQDIKKSIEIDNTNSFAYKHLGLLLLKEGKKSQACYNFEKAIELGYTEMYDDEVENLLKQNCK